MLRPSRRSLNLMLCAALVFAGAGSPALAADSSMSAVRFTLNPGATKPALGPHSSFLITRVGPEGSCQYSIVPPNEPPSPPISSSTDMRGLVLAPGEALQNVGPTPCVFSGILFVNPSNGQSSQN
jgi:hypothetical protein